MVKQENSRCKGSEADLLPVCLRKSKEACILTLQLKWTLKELTAEGSLPIHFPTEGQQVSSGKGNSVFNTNSEFGDNVTAKPYGLDQVDSSGRNKILNIFLRHRDK